jgi:hypothetical protein
VLNFFARAMARKEAKHVPEDAPKFIVFRDLAAGNSGWRLRFARAETVDFSRRGHRNKGDCEQEVQHLRNDEYPGARVRDLSVNRSES